MVGFSIGVEGGKWYFPIRHEIEPEYNLDPEQCLKWAAHVLGDERPKTGANLTYDVGWFREEGVTVRGPLFDVQFAEALLNSEAPNVALDVLAEKYLGKGKTTEFLYEWCADAYGGQVNHRQRKNIYRCSPRMIGPYGEDDANLPLQIIKKQWPELERLGLIDLFNMECSLIYLLIEMRYAGCPVDVDYFERLRAEFMGEIETCRQQMKHIVGFDVNANSSNDMAKAFDSLGLPYNMTAPTKNYPNGQPSFTADFLDTVNHPFAEIVRQLKGREKLVGTFIESYILDSHVNGEVHGQFHPLKGDKNGTRSGRLAGSTPNLQNIPIRTDEGRRIRNGFVALKGTVWRKYDYSQIEYRLLAHHAVGQGAEEIRQRYRQDPRTDYHEATQQLIFDSTNLQLDRGPTKTINFGLIYGMSQREMARRLHLSATGGADLFTKYHQAVPFAKETMDDCSGFAQRNGYIDTILGRRSLFDRWGPERFDAEAPALSFEAALSKYGRIQRAFTHKALNRRLQGGSADIIKKAMVRCWKDGIFDVTGVPRLTVHDELDFIDQGGRGEAFREMHHILETCVPGLRVPIVCDLEISPHNWGAVQGLDEMDQTAIDGLSYFLN
jgi:DNA polymerase-1